MKGDEQTEPGHPAPVEIDCDKARLIGDILRDHIASLGRERAMLPCSEVTFGPTAGGNQTVGPSSRGGDARGNHAGMTPENSASECRQMALPHALQRGIRSR